MKENAEKAVLMHLMVLRAFCPSDIYADNIKYLTS